MSKFNNLNPETVLAPFKATLGVHFPKVCNDIKAQLGRLEKDILTKSSGWTVGSKNAIVSKDGHKLMLPLNAPWTALLRFGMQLTAISDNGSDTDTKYVMTIESSLPSVCESWIQSSYRETKQPVNQV